MKKEAEIVSKIIRNNLSEKTSRISPLIGKGFVNQVFLVETNTAKYIVRMNHSNSLNEYEKEAWAVNKAIEKEILTPKILKIGVFKNQAYSIQEYVNGIEGRELSPNKKFIWKKLGEYARQIHTIKVGGFGLDFDDMEKGGSESKWLKYLNYNIESLNEDDELLRLNVLTRENSKTIRHIFENLKLQKFTFGLNHGDLSLKNTIISKNETVHLIDWGSAEASIVPHHDLIQLLKENIQENSPNDSEITDFLDGYGIEKDEYQKMLPELKGLLLLRAFDKLRWAIDRKINNLNDYILHVQKAIKKVLS